jgi:hypothetical protein
MAVFLTVSHIAETRVTPLLQRFFSNAVNSPALLSQLDISWEAI